MNAQELFLKDGKSAGVYYCENCKLVSKTLAEADDCCSPDKCQTCGAEAERYRMFCNSCQRKKEHAAEMSRFAKAEKLTQFDGHIVNGDKFYESVADMLDDIDDPAYIPEYVWATKPCNFINLNIEDVLDMAITADEAYEDFDESLSGVDELKHAIAYFNEANRHHISYIPDYTKAVLVKVE